MSALAPIAPKLGRLVRMLGSPIDGEIVAAAHAIDRTLKSASLDWHTLAEHVETELQPIVIYRRKSKAAAPPPAWSQWKAGIVKSVFHRASAAGILSAFEREFAVNILLSMCSASWRPSLKQGLIIDRIIVKAESRGVA